MNSSSSTRSSGSSSRRRSSSSSLHIPRKIFSRAAGDLFIIIRGGLLSLGDILILCLSVCLFVCVCSINSSSSSRSSGGSRSRSSSRSSSSNSSSLHIPRKIFSRAAGDLFIIIRGGLLSLGDILILCLSVCLFVCVCSINSSSSTRSSGSSRRRRSSSSSSNNSSSLHIPSIIFSRAAGELFIINRGGLLSLGDVLILCLSVCVSVRLCVYH
jgi:predicted ABC-type sugar transport system permease subunit